MSKGYSEDELWLVHLRNFNATGKGDFAWHLRAVLGGMLISDALRCGIESIEATITEEGWVLLGCDREWLQLNLPAPAGSRDLFQRLVHWPEDSQRTRHEYHAATVSSDVFIGRAGSFETIKGSPPPLTTIRSARGYPFVLGYKLPHDREHQPARSSD